VPVECGQLGLPAYEACHGAPRVALVLNILK
jgi:hypothetical protein